jgi:hypothetical protein
MENLMEKCKNYGFLKKGKWLFVVQQTFFHLTILSYKILNIKQSNVHILTTHITTGLEKGRS